MSTTTGQQEESSLTQEAAYWHARLRNEKLSEIEQTRFRAWLSGHPSRRREFEELSTLWDGLEGLANSPQVLAERREIARMHAAKNKARTRVPVTVWAAAAACVLAVLGVLLWDQSSPPAQIYTTTVGEQRTLQLSDESVVTLNTSSELRVHYSSRERRVDLVRGQASFDVAKNPERPFIVTAGQGQVRAVGTVFDVYKRPEKVVVTLIEGRVAIVPAALEQPVMLNAGEQLSYGDANSPPTRTIVDVKQVAAWRARKLNFVETPLRDALAEANRYSRVKIQLSSPELRDARISGVFEVGRNDALAEGLRAYFGLKVDRQGDDLIVLSEPPAE